ncbi:MAG: NAD(P)H-hydrate dehydratase [Anaerolineae bacterium]|nr:NAD(P)H-hydrate dehydratase [Anaerolineae bacterium]
MRLVTAEEMRHIERKAHQAGISYDTMMENAGRAVALAIQRCITSSGHAIVVLVGPGNNGGDGLVTARYLHQWGHAVSVYLWRRALDQDLNLERASELHMEIVRAEADPGWERLKALVGASDVLVDALLGTGAQGPLRGDLPQLLGSVHEVLAGLKHGPKAKALPVRVAAKAGDRSSPRSPLVVAVDVPSGLNVDTGEISELALKADLTVTLACPKLGHLLFPGADHIGKLWVADIGIDTQMGEDEAQAITVASPELVGSRLPTRPRDSHKGTFGKALIVAGSTNYVGAPCLASEAAYRVGAGLVTLAVAGPVYPLAASKLIETTFLVLPSDMGALVPDAVRIVSERIPEYDALLVGPGLGTEEVTGEFIQTLLRSGDRSSRRIGFRAPLPESKAPNRLPPTVIDADGLNLLAQEPRWWDWLPQTCILTPHPGEMARLCRCTVKDVEEDRLGIARDTARKWNCTVVLKGAYTVVASPTGALSVIPFANPILATAGTGDVLAGAITGLLAQGMNAYDAAECGAYVHGWSGELASAEIGLAGLLAGDLLLRLPQAIKRLRLQANRAHTSLRGVMPCSCL